MRFSWVEQSPNISKKTKGQFQNIWQQFWRGVFEPTVLQPAANTLSREIVENTERLGRVGIRVSGPTGRALAARGMGFHFNVLTGPASAGVAEGRAEAKKLIRRLNTIGESV